MLTETDIDLIHAWGDEIYTLRERLVSVIYIEETRDPITGEIVGKQSQAREVDAVVTEITSAVSGNDRKMIGGIILEEGDIKVDIKIELIEDVAELLSKIKYDNKDYEILASGKKGIGRRNRYEFIGRLIA